MLSTRQIRYLVAVLIILPCTLGIGAGGACAQETTTSELDSVAHDPGPSVEINRKSPGRALLFSTAGTVVPLSLATTNFGSAGLGLVATGFLLGPSLGHLYAENYDRALFGIGFRLGTPFLLGAMAGPSGVFVGLAIAAGSALYDIVTAGGSARAYNSEQHPRVQVKPKTGPTGNGVGIALHVTF